MNLGETGASVRARTERSVRENHCPTCRQAVAEKWEAHRLLKHSRKAQTPSIRYQYLPASLPWEQAKALEHPRTGARQLDERHGSAMPLSAPGRECAPDIRLAGAGLGDQSAIGFPFGQAINHGDQLVTTGRKFLRNDGRKLFQAALIPGWLANLQDAMSKSSRRRDRSWRTDADGRCLPCR